MASRNSKDKKFSTIIKEDFQSKDKWKAFKRDMQDIYEYYLDRESKTKLSEMGRLKRWFFIVLWMLKSMILKLTPLRRILLLVSIFFVIRSSGTERNANFEIGFILLFLILLAELKDKLAARDELAMGRAVQKELLPESNPLFPGWEVWLYTQSANEVSGDLIDYLELDKNRLGVTLGDVAGKGLGSALLMSKLQATVRALAPNYRSMAELGNQLNSIFCRDGLRKRFASLIYIEIESDSGNIRLLNAGHLPPIVIRSDKYEELPLGAPALGILPGAEYDELYVNLEFGDLLLVYSDGLTEARNIDGEFYGEERLFRILPGLKGKSAEYTGSFLVKEIEKFTGDARRNDDLSLVVLRRSS